MLDLSKYDLDDDFIKSIIPLDNNKIKVDKADKLSTRLAESFQDSTTMVKLLPGVKLWRFCSQKNKPRFSDCWIDPKTMKNLMNTFRTSHTYSIQYKKEEIRNKLAILEAWPTMLGYRVQIILKKELVAYIGTINTQELIKEVKDKVYFGQASAERRIDGMPRVDQLMERRKGGSIQIVIPRLSNRNLDQTENEFGKVTHFCSI